MITRFVLVHALVLGAALVAAPSAARAEEPGFAEMFGDHGTWGTVGVEYGRRSFSSTIMKGTPEKIPVDAGASSYAVAFRGTLWSPLNRTALGHTPAMHMDMRLGWWGEASGFRTAAEEAPGGLLLLIKSAFPWTLVERPHLRLGAGFGFGIGFEMGTLEPVAESSYFGLDLDGSLHLDAALYPTGDPKQFTVETVYEFAPAGVMHSGQHRVRVSAHRGAIGVSLRFNRSALVGGAGPDAGYSDFGLLVGYHAL